MNKIFSYIKGNKVTSAILGIVLVIAIVVVSVNNSDNSLEKYTVVNRDVVNDAVFSGAVEAESKADLGFAASGRIARIYVQNGEQVKQGALLAQLEISDLIADRQIKEAENRSTLVDLESAKDEIAKVKAEQNELVSSAYRTLLSEDLIAVPDSTSYTVEAPVISGAYNGNEGEYKIIIDQDNPTFDEYFLNTFGLEKTKIKIDENDKTALGSHGLYVSFPDDVASYVDTIWYIKIPNQKSTSYLSNYNAYQEAKRARDTQIKNAESKYEGLLAKESYGVSAVEAQINKINSEIRKNGVYAPFDGTISNLEKKVGESASVGEHIVSVSSALGSLQIALEVPELDVAKLEPEFPVEITLDAFAEKTFSGKIKTINSSETEISGVPVYKAYVEIENNPLIRNGMSAYGRVELSRRDNVLAVPLYLLTQENGKYFATVAVGKDTEKREVTIGIKGSDNFVEITSGLIAGEVIQGTPKVN